jgi:uncharacterized membrane protein
VAASEALDLRSGDLLTAGVAADNLVMTLYFLLLFALPSIAWLRSRYRDRNHDGAHPGPAGDAGTATATNDTVPLRIADVLGALALATVLVAVGYGVAAAMGWDSGGILVVTALTVILATLLPGPLARLAGATEIGTLLMMVFFAVIGASANIFVVVREGPILFVFAAIILTIHLVVILIAGKLLRLDLAEIVIASNANMGGPTTAAAMATARHWNALVTPAILCGTLGYAVATFIGTALGTWLSH